MHSVTWPYGQHSPAGTTVLATGVFSSRERIAAKNPSTIPAIRMDRRMVMKARPGRAKVACIAPLLGVVGHGPGTLPAVARPLLRIRSVDERPLGPRRTLTRRFTSEIWPPQLVRIIRDTGGRMGIVGSRVPGSPWRLRGHDLESGIDVLRPTGR
jgi:hypothetical protein